MKILICGLPGSGKTHLASRLKDKLECAWYNADEIRGMANDWDFSAEARLRQAGRMRNIADYEKAHGRKVMCDFVCPTEDTRSIFNADVTIFMDTIEAGRFENTNKIFERPTNPEYTITHFMTDDEIVDFVNILKENYHV